MLHAVEANSNNPIKRLKPLIVLAEINSEPAPQGCP
jgi:hypothetical protein